MHPVCRTKLWGAEVAEAIAGGGAQGGAWLCGVGPEGWGLQDDPEQGAAGSRGHVVMLGAWTRSHH